MIEDRNWPLDDLRSCNLTFLNNEYLPSDLLSLTFPSLQHFPFRIPKYSKKTLPTHGIFPWNLWELPMVQYLPPTTPPFFSCYLIVNVSKFCHDKRTNKHNLLYHNKIVILKHRMVKAPQKRTINDHDHLAKCLYKFPSQLNCCIRCIFYWKNCKLFSYGSTLFVRWEKKRKITQGTLHTLLELILLC